MKHDCSLLCQELAPLATRAARHRRRARVASDINGRRESLYDITSVLSPGLHFCFTVTDYGAIVTKGKAELLHGEFIHNCAAQPPLRIFIL